MQTIIIEFPDHLQLHAIGADGNVEVRTVKKSEVQELVTEKTETELTIYESIRH